MEIVSASALRTFDAAARLGSFKAAAEALSVTPTAVSHQIRTLEQQLGVALFIRATRKVTLSPAGEVLARASGPAFRMLDTALEELVEAERVLTVSTTPAFGALWLVPRIPDFEAKHPDIQLRVETSTARTDLGRDRSIDLALRYGRYREGSDSERPLLTETFAVFGSPAYLAALDDPATANLIATRWQSPNLPQVGWDRWCELAGINHPHNSSPRLYDQEQQVLQAGLVGQGLILISDVLVHDMVENGWLQPLRPDVRLPGLTYHAVTTNSVHPPAKTRRFLRWLEGQTAIE